MRHILTWVTAILLLFPSHSFAQTINLLQNGLTISQVATNAQTTLSPADTAEGDGEDHVKFFQTFWQSHAVANDSLSDSSGVNMFSRDYLSLRSAIVSRLTGGACTGSGFQGNWQVFGIDSLPGDQRIGKIDAVWASPTDSNYILAGATGGLFRTFDGGKNWACITDNAPLTGGVTAISNIAVNPADTNVIFLSTCEIDESGNVDMRTLNGLAYGNGILESYDGGATWHQEFIPLFHNWRDTVGFIQGVYFRPDGTRVYALYNNQLFTRSNSPAGPWKNITPLSGCNWSTSWRDLQFDPSDQNHFFVVDQSSGYGLNSAIFESHVPVPDSANWSEISLSLPTYIIPAHTFPGGVVPADTLTYNSFARLVISVPGPDTLYAVGLSIHTNYNSVLYKYSLAAASWSVCSKIPDSYNPSINTMVLRVSAANRANIYYGNDELFMSGNFGHTFSLIGGYYTTNNHADVRSLCLQKAGSAANGVGDILFTANDGGVGRKPSGINAITAGAASMIDISGHGLECSDFWGIDMSYDGRLMVGGTQHDGFKSYESRQATPWVTSDIYGDASGACFDKQHDQGIVYTNGKPEITEPLGTRQLGGVALDNGSLSDQSSRYIIPFYVDDTGNRYIGLHSLWVQPPGSTSWNPVSSSYGLPGLVDSEYIVDMTFSHYYNSFTGYVLYNRNSSQLFEYRNLSASVPAFINIGLTVPNTTPTVDINCVTMDPLQPQKVWIGMGGADVPVQAQYSLNAGGTWYDVSYGLPPHVPITKMIYTEGTSDILFCATDVGIYRCDFSTFNPAASHYGVEWTCFNNAALSGNGFPNVMITDMKINYCQQKLYMATYGRGVWSSDINPNVAPESTDTITTTTTWSGGNQYIAGGIYIKPGATLTISGDTVHMPKNGAIIVAPGAHLIVSHSMLTNDCDQCFWRGIAAAGSTAATQTTAHQAWVTITGGSTIQHAVTAVADYNSITDTAAATTTGGIIQAFGSSFTDNQNAVTLRNYQHTTATGAYVPDLSYFHDCTFLLDNKYKGDALSLPMIAHVSMAGVHGISFTGCQFLNRDTSAYSVQKGEGIRSIDASFNVTPYCSSPVCYTPLRSRFCGFTNGISVQGTVSLDLTTSIDQADFDTVGVGIYVSADNSVSATNCNFTVGHAAQVNDVAQLCGGQNIGIYHQNSELFRVEGNTFHGIASTAPYWVNYGAVLINDAFYGGTTVSFPNKVYRNTFNGLTYGVTAIGDNTSAAFPSGGLEISCNHFSSNTNDIFTAGDGGFYPQGISIWQGTATLPAGNTFSGSSYNINNNAGSIRYYYNTADATQHPSYATTTAVTLIGTTAVNSCPSSLAISGSGGLGLGGPHMAVHRSAFINTRDTLLDSLALYNHLIDYGNTDSLMAIIDTSADTGTLYNLLHKASPWLSEAALRETGDDGMFPYASMMQILQQNPDVLRDDDFLYYMQGDYGFSENDLGTLLSAALTNTSRSSLESRIQTCNITLGDEANIIMMAVKSPLDTNVSPQDTTGAGICTDSNSVYFTLDSNSYYYTLDSTDTWLQRIGGDWTCYARIGYWNGRGQYATANLLEQQLPNLLSQKYYKVQFDTFSAAWAYLYPVEHAYTGGGVFPLTSLPPLRTYTGVPPLTDNNAMQVINTISGGTRNPAPPTPDPCSFVRTPSHRHSGPPKFGPGSMAAASSVTVYPNPAGGTVTFTCNVPAASSLNIVITNIMGEHVAIIPTANGQGKTLWDTRSQPAGVYLYQVIAPGSVVAQGKLVIIK